MEAHIASVHVVVIGTSLYVPYSSPCTTSGTKKGQGTWVIRMAADHKDSAYEFCVSHIHMDD